MSFPLIIVVGIRRIRPKVRIAEITSGSLYATVVCLTPSLTKVKMAKPKVIRKTIVLNTRCLSILLYAQDSFIFRGMFLCSENPSSAIGVVTLPQPHLRSCLYKLLEICFEADPSCVLIPAHAWTPWFSIFGSMSGFDLIEECFDELSPKIFAIETGLSSDPAMNWRLSKLDKISLISNSDSHSLQKIGREANVFDCDLSYGAIIGAIKSRDPKKFLFTVEFFPEEGKYHYTGHSACGVSQGPEETKKNKGICPKCGKKLTIGVMDRVEALADQKVGGGAERVQFKSAIPLQEVIADALGMAGVSAKSVVNEYEKLVSNLGNEFNVLFDASEEEIAAFSNSRIAEGVMLVRGKKVNLIPGYDGEYGKISIFKKDQKASVSQNSLF